MGRGCAVSGEERWAPVPGWDGYEVSDQGRIRSLDRIVQRKDGSRQIVRGRMLAATREKRDGRSRVRLHREGCNVQQRVHRLVLEAFVGPAPVGMIACHNNGDASDDRLSNLRWDTRSANELDKVRHGTHHEARKTHCVNGHEYTSESTYWSARRGRPERKCRTCHLAKSRAKHARIAVAGVA